MFIREKAYENAIQKIRVDFGTLIGEEKDEDAYVVLKELRSSSIRCSLSS